MPRLFHPLELALAKIYQLGLGVAFMALTALLITGAANEELGAAQESLQAGSEVLLEMSPQSFWSFELPAEAGKLLEVEAEQLRADVALRLIGPDGEDLSADTTFGAVGREVVRALAGRGAAAKPWRLEVSWAGPAESPPGELRLRLAPPRLPSAADMALVRASAALDAGLELRGEAALGQFQEAAVQAQAGGDNTLQAVALCWAGRQLKGLGRRGEHLAALEAAQNAVSPRHHQERWAILRAAAGAWEQAALRHENRGHRDRALTARRQTALRYREAEHWRGVARNLDAIGKHYLDLARFDLARDYLRDALRLRRRAGDHKGEARTLGHLGRVERRAQRFSRAQEYFEAGLAITAGGVRDLGLAKLRVNLLIDRGQVHADLGRFSAARADYSRALALMDSLEAAHPGETLDQKRAMAEINYGWLLERQESYNEALASFDRAAPLLGPGEPAQQRAAVRRGRALALAGLGRLREAEAALAEALELIEEERASTRAGDLQAAWVDWRWVYVETYLDLLWQLDQQEPDSGWAKRALHALEASRARSLRQALVADPSRDRTTDPSRQQRVLLLHKQIRELERRELRLEAGGAPVADRADLRGQVRRRLSELQQLQGEERSTAAGEPGQANAPPPQPTLTAYNLELLQDLLRSPSGEEEKGTALLEIALGEVRSFLFLLTADTLEWSTLPPRHEIEALARASRRAMVLAGRRAASPSAPQSAALRASLAKPLALSELLFSGAMRRLLNDHSLHRLAIVPDGALADLPFPALPVPAPASVAPGAEPFPVGEPLITRFEVVQLPSASALVELRRRAAQRIHSDSGPEALALVMADAVYGLEDPRLAGSRTTAEAASGRSRLEPYQRLQHSAREAAAIQRLSGGKEIRIFQGFEMQLDQLLASEPGRYRILHLAGHARVRADAPDLSYLALSRFHADGRPRVGELFAWSVRHLELKADLVVLSACDTARGQELRGEGVVGLANPFLEAGGSRVLASLWLVDDEATASLMESFYQAHLGHGLSAAAALRQAQLSMRADPRWQQPSYWAPFVLLGDWR